MGAACLTICTGGRCIIMQRGIEGTDSEIYLQVAYLPSLSIRYWRDLLDFRHSGDIPLLKIRQCSRHPIPEVIISAFGALYLPTGSLKLGPALTRSPRSSHAEA